MDKSTKKILFYLRVCVFLVFIGRAYQHIFWDAPFRSLLWDQKLLEPLVLFFFNMDWNSYVTDLEIDKGIQVTIRLQGVLYLICAFLALVVKPTSKKIMKVIIWAGGASLVFLSLLITKEKFYHLAMLFEHAIQFGSPFLLLYFLKHQSIEKLKIQLKILIALTFICHGLYAIGEIYPLPQNFMTMTLNILPIDESAAKMLLFVAGILDFLIAILIFIPKAAKSVLIYAIFWGLLTALARVVSGLTYSVSLDILHQYLYLTVYRLPHGILPFVLYMIISNKLKPIKG